FEIYKSPSFYKIAVFSVTFVVGFANVFTIINPSLNGNVRETIFSILGPVLFGVIAYVMYTRYEKKQK
ncbi:MAG: glutamate/gamma-aminobutyrate family transporter YjeM, partial [Vagococcus sp.]